MKKVTVHLTNADSIVFENPKKSGWITDGRTSLYDVLDKQNVSYQYPSTSILCIKTELINES